MRSKSVRIFLFNTARAFFQISAQLIKLGGPRSSPSDHAAAVSKLLKMTDLEDKLLRKMILERLDLTGIVGRSFSSNSWPGKDQSGDEPGEESSAFSPFPSPVVAWKMLLALPGNINLTGRSIKHCLCQIFPMCDSFRLSSDFFPHLIRL